MRSFGLIIILLSLCSCASYYYKGYDENYYASNFPGYQSKRYYYRTYKPQPVQSYPIPQTPISVRPLTTQDFYMLDNHPEDYFNTQMWEASSGIGSYAIHNFFENIFARF